MKETNYDACATRPEEIIMCSALDAGDYPERYAEKVSRILRDIKDDALKEKARQTLGSFESGSDGKLAQSSPYRLVALQEIFPQGKVLVTRPRLQIAKENKGNFMAGLYVDCELNLFASSGAYQINPILAKELGADLKDVGIDSESARLIPYHILTDEVSKESPSGLVFRLSEKGKDIAKQAVLNTLDFKWNHLPNKGGLFRAYLGRYGCWDAYGEDLANSGDDGRVVVETTSEAGSREFERLKKQTEELFDRQRKERRALAEQLLA